MEALLITTAAIFVAELGDKSQLMALALATRHRATPVLVGITIATATVHAVSVLVGVVIGANLPTHVINVAAGIAFLGFAWWTWRGDELTDEDEARVQQSNRSVVFAVAGTFFLAELGDKTMLATITLATTYGAWETWIGSTVGMVAADALAIVVGRALGKRLPERAIKIGATAAFVIFGLILLVEGLAG